jgi:hypothetical protein
MTEEKKKIKSRPLQKSHKFLRPRDELRALSAVKRIALLLQSCRPRVCQKVVRETLRL